MTFNQQTAVFKDQRIWLCRALNTKLKSCILGSKTDQVMLTELKWRQPLVLQNSQPRKESERNCNQPKYTFNNRGVKNSMKAKIKQ